MKTASPLRRSKPAGLTLLETTVVLAVLLALVAVTMVGTRAWRLGSDRAACMVTMRNVQASVRAYQNLYGYESGTLPHAEDGTQSIADHLLAKGYITPVIHDQITGTTTCPGGGDYTIAQEDVFPMDGDLYVKCSLGSTRRHLLPAGGEW